MSTLAVNWVGPPTFHAGDIFPGVTWTKGMFVADSHPKLKPIRVR